MVLKHIVYPEMRQAVEHLVQLQTVKLNLVEQMVVGLLGVVGVLVQHHVVEVINQLLVRVQIQVLQVEELIVVH